MLSTNIGMGSQLRDPNMSTFSCKILENHLTSSEQVAAAISSACMVEAAVKVCRFVCQDIRQPKTKIQKPEVDLSFSSEISAQLAPEKAIQGHS